jgi:hypothetical protein
VVPLAEILSIGVIHEEAERARRAFPWLDGAATLLPGRLTAITAGDTRLFGFGPFWLCAPHAICSFASKLAYRRSLAVIGRVC